MAPETQPSTLRAEGLSKRFKLRQVVNQISLEIRSGEVVGLLGPNGAGKTTAFYMLVGLITADAGRISLDGQNSHPVLLNLFFCIIGPAWAWATCPRRPRSSGS